MSSQVKDSKTRSTSNALTTPSQQQTQPVQQPPATPPTQGLGQTRSGAQVRSWQPQEAKRAKVEAGDPPAANGPIKQEPQQGGSNDAPSLAKDGQDPLGPPEKVGGSSTPAATPTGGGKANGAAAKPSDSTVRPAGSLQPHPASQPMSQPGPSQGGGGQPGVLPPGSSQQTSQPGVASPGQPVISLPASHLGAGRGAGFPNVSNYTPVGYPPPHSQAPPGYSLLPQGGLVGQTPFGSQPRPPGGITQAGIGSSGLDQRQGSGSEADNGDGKQVSTSDIQRVQNYIEKCLQMYLTQKEVVGQLQQQFKIEPCFTQLVWQKLEEQNQEFFKAYYTRLKLKDQIVLFNHLLDEQVKMFGRMPHGGHLMPGAHMAQQPYPGLGPGFPQQAAPGNPPGALLGSQPPPLTSHSSQPMGNASFVPTSAPEGVGPMDTPADGMLEGGFPGLEGEDMHGDLALAQSLPFSASEMNLANMVSLGSIGRGLNHHDQDLGGMPRNFSLSDLDITSDPHSLMPRDISISDFPSLDLDPGGGPS